MSSTTKGDIIKYRSWYDFSGSIVGSGELIATTRTKPSSIPGFLWLIIIGCVVKVFAQIELGKNTIVNGKTSLAALNELPGPEFVFQLEKLILIQTGSYFLVSNVSCRTCSAGWNCRRRRSGLLSEYL